MKITSKGRYGIKIMLELTKNYPHQSLMKSKEIAKKQKIPIKYLEQIINSLRKCDLVLSIRGAEGGYQLARNPELITIYDILKCLEGNLSIIEKKGDIAKGEAGQFWKEIDLKIEDMLSINLKDFLNKIEGEAVENAIMYFI